MSSEWPTREMLESLTAGMYPCEVAAYCLHLLDERDMWIRLHNEQANGCAEWQVSSEAEKQRHLKTVKRCEAALRRVLDEMGDA